jgi:hypothetical protein
VTTSQVKSRWPLELQSASSTIQEFLPIEPTCWDAPSPLAAELPTPIAPAQPWQSQQWMESAMLAGPRSFQRPAQTRSTILQIFSTARPAAGWIRISF